MSSAPDIPTPTATGSITRPRRRVPFWDNARFACIVLVVLGHGIQRLIYDSDISYAFYLSFYAFHMPALRSSPATSRRHRRPRSGRWCV